jgi:hypothetical protein
MPAQLTPMTIAVTGAFGYSGRYIPGETLGHRHTSEMAGASTHFSPCRSN